MAAMAVETKAVFINLLRFMGHHLRIQILYLTIIPGRDISIGMPGSRGWFCGDCLQLERFGFSILGLKPGVIMTG
jgi:hypothetical protein